MENPENSIVQALKNLSNQFHRFMAGIKAEIAAKIEDADQVTELQGRTVSYLYWELEEAGREAVYQKDVEKFFNIRRSTATVILKRMEKNGLIVRNVSSSDGRMKAITLTEKSKKVFPTAHREFEKAERKATEGVTSEELAVFLRVIGKILKNIS